MAFKTLSIPCSFSTDCYIGSNLLHTLLPTLCRTHGSQSVILTAGMASSLYGPPLSALLNAPLIELPAGEEAKTLSIVQKIQHSLSQLQCTRDTVILALGGGALLDAAAFIAATYLRGLPLILVPTTLLAMVDASIGGKTGINTESGKNRMGAYYFPKAVISDLDLLKSLAPNEHLNGWAEILKMALIAVPQLLRPNISLEESVREAVEAKLSIVQEDPFEQKGLRRILNFGHTVGHALEKATHYALSHGEAVAIGCVIESFLSNHLGYLPQEQWVSIQTLFATRFSQLHLPLNYNRSSFLQALRMDKKNTRQQVRSVLIDQIGHAIPFEGEYCLPLSEHHLQEATDKMEQLYAH